MARQFMDEKGDIGTCSAIITRCIPAPMPLSTRHVLNQSLAGGCLRMGTTKLSGTSCMTTVMKRTSTKERHIVQNRLSRHTDHACR